MKLKDFENVTILVIIGVCILCGILFKVDTRFADNQLSAVLFAIALAGIAYKYLGGLGESNSFHLGALKLGGSAAVLAAFIYLLARIIFVADGTVTMRPSSGWYAIDSYSGKPITVSINDSIRIAMTESDRKNRARHKYTVMKGTGSYYQLHLEEDTAIAGTANMDSLDNVILQNKKLLIHGSVDLDIPVSQLVRNPSVTISRNRNGVRTSQQYPIDQSNLFWAEIPDPAENEEYKISLAINGYVPNPYEQCYSFKKPIRSNEISCRINLQKEE